MIFFCPNCWEELKKEEKRCPFCGSDLENFSKLSYEDKLIVALSHPVLSYRVNAVNLLGKLSCEKAVCKFEKMVETEDVITVLEIINALGMIGSNEAVKLLNKLANNTSPVISKRAKAVLNMLKSMKNRSYKEENETV